MCRRIGPGQPTGTARYPQPRDHQDNPCHGYLDRTRSIAPQKNRREYSTLSHLRNDESASIRFAQKVFSGLSYDDLRHAGVWKRHVLFPEHTHGSTSLRSYEISEVAFPGKALDTGSTRAHKHYPYVVEVAAGSLATGAQNKAMNGNCTEHTGDCQRTLHGRTRAIFCKQRVRLSVQY